MTAPNPHPVDLPAILQRLNSALADNQRLERVFVGMAVAIFVLGLSIILVGYLQTNPYVTGGAAALQALLYYPMREVRQVRRENLSLQVAPILIASLPPRQAVQELIKLLAMIRGVRDVR